MLTEKQDANIDRIANSAIIHGDIAQGDAEWLIRVLRETVDELEVAEAEVERLRAACVDAEVVLREVLERYDDELRGAARGDVDNVRLDLLKAAEAAKEEQCNKAR
ncbi:MAG: hypothetical protein V1755_06610 [Chloroflexota bacterium]